MTTPRRRPARGAALLSRLGAAVGIALLVAVGSVAGATPALAHDVLVSSDPANGATLDTAPRQVSFTFDQPVQNFDPALKVFGPGGNEFTTAPPTVLGNTVSAPMAAGPAGTYRAAYRIVSADGHPVTGEITFTLSDAAAGTAIGTPTTGAAASSSGAATATAGGSGGMAAWVWVIIAAAAVLVVAAVVMAVRKPRNEH